MLTIDMAPNKKVSTTAHAQEQHGEHARHQQRHRHRLVAEQPLHHQHRQRDHQHVGNKLPHNVTIKRWHHAQQQDRLHNKKGAVVPAHQLAQHKAKGAAKGNAQALAHVIGVQLAFARQQNGFHARASVDVVHEADQANLRTTKQRSQAAYGGRAGRSRAHRRAAR